MKYVTLKEYAVVIAVAGILVGCGTQGEEQYRLGDYDCNTYTYTECEISDVNLEIYAGDMLLEVEVDEPEVDAVSLEGVIDDGSLTRTFNLSIGDVCHPLYDNINYDGEIVSEFVYTEHRSVNDHLYRSFYAVDIDSVGYLDGSGGYTLDLSFGGDNAEDGSEEDNSIASDEDQPDEVVEGIESLRRDIVLSLRAQIEEKEGKSCTWNEW